MLSSCDVLSSSWSTGSGSDLLIESSRPMREYISWSKTCVGILCKHIFWKFSCCIVGKDMAAIIPLNVLGSGSALFWVQIPNERKVEISTHRTFDSIVVYKNKNLWKFLWSSRIYERKTLSFSPARYKNTICTILIKNELKLFARLIQNTNRSDDVEYVKTRNL